jgi:macrolide-specific efflux system membrane fusion protein
MKLKLFAILVLAAVGVGAVIFAAGGIRAGSGQTPQYLTATASVGDVVQDASATGTVEASRTYGLAFGSAAHLIDDSSSSSSNSTSSANGSSTTWPVLSVSAKVGATVKMGDVLAKADATDLKVELATATDQWLAANLELDTADEQLADAQDADNTDAERQAQIAVYNAKNQVAQAQQTREDLQAQIRHATLKAPISGVIVEVNVVAGLDGPSGDAIVIDSSALQVTADVVEADLPSLKVGQPATVTVSAADATLTGKVTSIAPAAASTSGNSSVVSYPIAISIQDTTGKVRSGMSADVSITTASATNVLRVPSTALAGANGQYAVRTLDATGTVVTRPVTVGLITSSMAEIKDGLAEGETVVTGVATAQTTTTGGFGGFGVPGGGLGGGGIRQGGQGGQGTQGQGTRGGGTTP